uniref:Uncharacterized protein n=1 Tax=Populus alba TaxID=43335 RepID=A0A4V6XX25_POPAL|nr:hypothetical protein D5086_0000083160 [Populus alba]
MLATNPFLLDPWGENQGRNCDFLFKIVDTAAPLPSAAPHPVTATDPPPRRPAHQSTLHATCHHAYTVHLLHQQAAAAQARHLRQRSDRASPTTTKNPRQLSIAPTARDFPTTGHNRLSVSATKSAAQTTRRSQPPITASADWWFTAAKATQQISICHRPQCHRLQKQHRIHASTGPRPQRHQSPFPRTAGPKQNHRSTSLESPSAVATNCRRQGRRH